jgi:hypothetical protein
MSYFLDDLADHPDAMELEIAGQPFQWFLNQSAFEEAEERGIDFSSFAELDEEDIVGNLDALSTLLFVGTLPFDAEIEKADFKEVISPRVAQDLGPKLISKYQGLEDEQLPDAVTSGK